ncbi:hypothetical protein [Mucilaginibacter gotjawali]|uniref:Uncharacterized protein n=2 Tax=Mucilaginibacter gotjawali TaxID=1550579 RepID=A0A839SDU2_9SPHI|nr:hypothetical protein [Mucilaginibacter gotjawali]MBB3056391.1 hypothetical protein [Mucilaginibacter gotjawali]BAU55098.1 hypothetical protein MgSA37_03279 [Mucilaginibacter gotjawali]
MKIVKVTYTTTAGYAEQNQRNIKKVMSDLQELAHPGIFYHVCMGADGKSFTHTAFFSTEEYQQILFDLVSFQTFQSELKQSGLDSPPKQEFLTLVGSSKQIFNEKIN